MTREADNTLAKIRQRPVLAKDYRLSDFVSKQDVQGVRRNNIRGKRGKRQFDDVDAYTAEMIARFGYNFYERWNSGEINQFKVDRWMQAERARERAQWLPFEGFIRALIQGGVPTYRPKHIPKIGKQVLKIIKAEIKAARGEE